MLGFSQTAAVEEDVAPGMQITGPQKFAAWAYFFSLIYALALWGFHDNFANVEKHPYPDIVIMALGQSILGLFGGALAVILNVNGDA